MHKSFTHITLSANASSDFVFSSIKNEKKKNRIEQKEQKMNVAEMDGQAIKVG